MADEILVYGRRQVSQDGNPSANEVYYAHNSSRNTWSSVARNPSGGYTITQLPSPPSDFVDDPSDSSDVIKVTVQNTNNTNATIAASNIIKTINIIVKALKVSNQSSTTSVFGKLTTVAELSAFISKSTFEVNETPPNNGGVGIATPNGNGGGRFVWYYAAFDGDSSNSTGSDYAHPNYTNNQGMNAIVLHDIAHATSSGEAFNKDSYSWSQRSKNEGLLPNNMPMDSRNPFWNNNEAMANSSARGIANTSNIDISTWSPREGFNGVAHVAIYNNLKNP